jgi:hypothetical protein
MSLFEVPDHGQAYMFYLSRNGPVMLLRTRLVMPGAGRYREGLDPYTGVQDKFEAGLLDGLSRVF